MGRSVSVTGRGEASAPYDRVTLALGATARAASPGDATTRAGYALSRVREAALARGVGPADLATGAVSLVPVHDPWPTVVAYEASFALRVTTDDLDGVGSLLVAAVDAGGDGARVDAVTFGYRDPAAMEREARALAYANARAKAEHYAGLTGQALGEVRHMVEGAVSGAVPMPRAQFAKAAASAPPQLDAGEGVVTALVTVEWALGPAV
jgi:uncharacterized protein YggE